MRKIRLAIAVALPMLAVCFAGCGESAPPVTKEALTSKTDTAAFKGMMEDQTKNLKGGGAKTPAK